MLRDPYEKQIAEIIIDHFKELDDVVKKCDKLQKCKNAYYQALNESNLGIDSVIKRIFDYQKKVVSLDEECTNLRRNIGALCDGLNTIEPLTVGLFGEWGSGKTYLLKAIREEIDRRQEVNIKLWENTKKQLDIDSSQPLTVPVFFNAWRFEKEEHIIIPLAKTLTATLKEYPHIPQMARIHSKFKLLTTALIKGLKAPKESPDFHKLFHGDLKELKKIVGFFDPEIVRRNASHEAILQSFLDGRLEEIYLHIPRWIEAIILMDNVRFLFLIDDLDRCLPENSLKMLESIKLFLDVPGCAFVLALDDDVIERGVEHHYREYIFHRDDPGTPAAPITGGEYLEKIVQLPFRIPPIESVDIESYLLAHFQSLLAIPSPKRSEASSSDRNTVEDEAQTKIDETLLEFLSRQIPPVPRKIVRVMNLYRLKLTIIQSFDSDPDRILIAKLVLLELFAPNLYRFLKNDHHQFRRAREWIQEHKSLTETDEIKASIQENIQAQKEKELASRLIDLITQARRSRISIDLDAIFADMDDDKLKAYIYLKRPSEPPKHSRPKDQSQIPKALPSDIAEFESYLFSNDEISWEKAFEEDPRLQRAFLQLYDGFIDKAKDFVTNPRWLQIVSEHLSTEDFKTLIEPYATDPRWLRIVGEHLSTEDFKTLIEKIQPIQTLMDEDSDEIQ